MKTVVLVHPDGDRVELFIDGRRVDWVHLRRFKSPVHQQMVYETPSEIERALLVRFGDLTKRGFQVADEAPRARTAIDIEPEVFERGVAPLVVRRLDAHDRAKATAWLADFEQRGLVALPGLDEQKIVPHVPVLHRFVLGMQTRTLVLDGDSGRDLSQVVTEASKMPPHRAWLRAWLDAIQAAPGTIRELCLRACRLHDVDPSELAARLEPLEGIAFVGGFPRDFGCAVHAKSLTVGLTDPAGELPDAVIDALAAAPLRVERLAIEIARGHQEVSSPLAAALRGASVPALRELAVTGLAPTTLIAALVESPLLARLTCLRIDAAFDADTLEVVRSHAAALGHLARLELRVVPGSAIESVASLSAALPNVVELVGAPPVCPY